MERPIDTRVSFAVRVAAKLSQGALLVGAVLTGRWLDDLLLGPTFVRVVIVAAVLVTARATFSLVMQRLIPMWPVWPPFAASGLENQVVYCGLRFVVYVAAWSFVAVTGSLFASAVLATLLTVRTFAMASSLVRMPESDPIDDPRLEARLRRFCAELGIVDLMTRFVERTSERSAGVSPFEAATFGGPRVGQPVLVLLEWLRDTPERVMDTVIAHAVVRHNRRGGRYGENTAELLAMLGVLVGAALLHHSLLRISHLNYVGAPGFLPMIAVTWSLAALAAAALRAPFAHAAARGDVARVLDLTRDPDTFLELMPDTTRWRTGVFAWFHPDLSRTEAEDLVGRWKRSNKVCLLFTDIVGSTELLDSLGDDAWDSVIFEHDRRLRGVFAARQGRVIDRAGDGYAVSFDDVGSAVLAAMEAQKSLWDLEARPGEPVRVRIGCHTGEVIRREDAVIGREMHITARVCGLAEGGEILATEEVVNELKDVTRFTFGPMRREHLRGFADDHGVAQVCFAIDE